MCVNTLTDDKMYEALLAKDVSFEGIFFACVKTTGIFCRPTCPARKPKRKNVEFVPSAKEALGLGYRPCKVCSPLKLQGITPDWMGSLLKEVEKNPQLRIKDEDLLERGLHPNRVRRWFLKHHGMTFQAYQRSIRISYAFGTVKHGESKVIHAAYDSGYESLSGFHEAFKKATGFSPKNSKEGKLIYVTRVLTPLGPMMACATDEGICLLEFMERKELEAELAQLAKIFKASYVTAPHPHFELLQKELDAYFHKELTTFTVPIHSPGTPFQTEVWNALRQVPYGTTLSYKEHSERMGKPKAVRAVANANGKNRIAIIIPCHRIIGSNGKLTGYAGGLHRKEYLLELEKG